MPELANIPNRLHLVSGPPGPGKTTTIVPVMWALTEAGHKSLGFTTTNAAADHLTSTIYQGRPGHLSHTKILRIEFGPLEDLMMLRSAQFDESIPNADTLNAPRCDK